MKKTFYYIIAVLGILVTLATLLSLIPTEDLWWIKLLDFPRIQFLILAFLCLILLLFLRKDWSSFKRILVTGLIATLLIQTYYLYPYTGIVEPKIPTLTPGDLTGAVDFDLMIANVYIKNRETEDLFRMITERDPDIFLAMETDLWWENALQPIDESYPYGMEYPLDNSYGMILYSKFPLRNEKIRFLNYDSVPSFHALMDLPQDRVIQFHGVHPVPPVPKGPNKLAVEEKALEKVGKLVAQQSYPAIVAGDLNDVAWVRTENLFEQNGLLEDIRVGRGFYNTFNAKSWFLRWPLDYIFTTTDFRVIDLERLSDFNSDHFPLFTRMSLVKDRATASQED